MSEYKKLTNDVVQKIKQDEKELVDISSKYLATILGELKDLIISAYPPSEDGKEEEQEESREESFESSSECIEFDTTSSPVEIISYESSTDEGGSYTHHHLHIYGEDVENYSNIFEEVDKLTPEQKVRAKEICDEFQIIESIAGDLFIDIILDSKVKYTDGGWD